MFYGASANIKHDSRLDIDIVIACIVTDSDMSSCVFQSFYNSYS